MKEKVAVVLRHWKDFMKEEVLLGTRRLDTEAVRTPPGGRNSVSEGMENGKPEPR